MAHGVVGWGEDHVPLLFPLVQEVLELLQVAQSPVSAKILKGLDSVDQPVRSRNEDYVVYLFSLQVVFLDFVGTSVSLFPLIGVW